MGRAWSIRTYLVAFVLAAVVPVVVFAAVLVGELGRRSVEAISSSVRETARALTSAVERHLISSVRPLELLAASAALDEGDLEAFRADARRALASQPAWRNVVLASTDGQVVADALDEPTPRSSLQDRESFVRVLEERAPSVGRLLERSYVAGPSFAVRVPVERHGRIRWVLSAIVSPSAIQETLALQDLPPAWEAKVFDQRETIVAGTHEPSLAGVRVAPVLRSAPPGEGWLRGLDRQGALTYAAYAHASSGWGVAITLPAAAFEEPTHRFIAVVLGGGAVLLFVAALGAVAVGQRIARPLRVLAESAAALGSGDVLAVVPGRIVEIRRVAQALESARRERQHAEAALRRAIRMREEMLAIVSHDLRNPLSAIRLSAASLAHAELPPDVSPSIARVAATVERSVARMDRLIRDLLDMAAIEAGGPRVATQSHDLEPVIAEALEMLQPQARQKEQTLACEITPGLRAKCDRERIVQILANLLGNALKFTPEHGRVVVHASRCDDAAVVSVRDTGPGIAAEDLPHLFERYWQGGRRKTPGGVGLGLAIAKSLVAAHGGRIWAESHDGGATISFTLPIAA